MPIIQFTTHHAKSEYNTLSLEEARAKAKLQMENDKGCNFRESSEWQDGVTVFTWDTYVGKCIVDRERNGYDDSDFYMLVYIEETDSFAEICFASTRGWSYPAYGSRPDATPEVIAKYTEYQNRLYEARRKQEEEEEANTIRKGKIIEVIKGRKVAIGTRGECFWIGDSAFGLRVGLRDDQGKVHWTAANNCLVVR